MPYRVVGHPNEDLSRSLGRLAYWWIRTFVIYGPGSVQGQPVRLGPDSINQLRHMYALDENGKRLYSTAFMSEPKGTDKSGRGAYLVCFEAVGPARFAGWANGGETYTFLGRTYTYAPGEPMGRPVKAAIIRCVATEEGQAGNVYDVVLHNFQKGPLASLGLGAFNTYIDLGDGGFVYPSTASAASKDGGKETFIVFDETHLFVTPQLKATYNTLSRNQTKRPLEEPWYLETTTMFEPGAKSIAELTYETADLIQQGRVRKPNLLYMHRWGQLKEEEISDEAKLRAALIEASGDAAKWLDPDVTITKIYDPRTSLADSIRYYLNALAGVASSWIRPTDLKAVETSETLQPGDEVALGFDGSLTDDHTALVAIRLKDNLAQLLHHQGCPDGTDPRLWSVDKHQVSRAVAEAFETFDVKAFAADPPHWQEEVDEWEREYGDRLAPMKPQHAIATYTANETKMMINAIERTSTLIVGEDLRISTENAVLSDHILNARTVTQRNGGVLIYKEFKHSRRKIDCAMALVLAVAASVRARNFVPKEKASKDPNHGLVASVPLDLLVPKFRR